MKPADKLAVVVPPDVQSIEKAVQPLLHRVRDIQINTDEDYYNAQKTLKDLSTAESELLPPFKANVKIAKASWESAKDLLARFADPLANAKQFLGGKISEYRQKKERERIAEQNRINAENKRIADEAAQRERDRLAKIAADTEAERVRKAEELRAKGQTEAADEAIQAAANLRELDEMDTEEAVAAAVPPPQQITLAAPVLPKVSGVSSRRNYKFEVDDVNALPAEFIKPKEADLVAIGEKVRKQKEATSMTPTPSKLINGISVWFEETDFTRKYKNDDSF